MVLDKSAQAGQHSFAERGEDVYETPACAVEALLKIEKLPVNIWEPACGPGAIVRVLRAVGHSVYASDLHDYGGVGCDPGVDFLTNTCLGQAEAIITNPPYKQAQQFVEVALKRAPLVIMLLRLAFLESSRRAHILDRGSGLARIHVFSNRLPMIHRHNWTGPRASSAIAFCWMVWERGHDGPATIDRIKWT
jgi:hypothetical protein